MKYFVVDAFTSAVFKGNPAGVCLLEHAISEELMQNIAAENHLSETAFLVPAEGGYDLRWFTPEVEVDLCGHATLASAFVVRNFVDMHADKMDFFTQSGTLSVAYQDGLFKMDFPSRPPQPIDMITEFKHSVGCDLLEAHLSRDLLLLVKDEAAVRNIHPNFDAMRKVKDGFGLIVTAQGDDVDFVSRFFVPKAGVREDPVTGSAHSTLIPFWSKRLGKQEMVAQQLSQRGGTLYCQNRGERVQIAGHAALYLIGEIHVGDLPE